MVSLGLANEKVSVGRFPDLLDKGVLDVKGVVSSGPANGKVPLGG